MKPKGRVTDTSGEAGFGPPAVNVSLAEVRYLPLFPKLIFKKKVVIQGKSSSLAVRPGAAGRRKFPLAENRAGRGLYAQNICSINVDGCMPLKIGFLQGCTCRHAFDTDF